MVFEDRSVLGAGGTITRVTGGIPELTRDRRPSLSGIPRTRRLTSPRSLAPHSCEFPEHCEGVLSCGWRCYGWARIVVPPRPARTCPNFGPVTILRPVLTLPPLRVVVVAVR